MKLEKDDEIPREKIGRSNEDTNDTRRKKL